MVDRRLSRAGELARRAAVALVTVAGVTLLAFVAISLAPGDAGTSGFDERNVRSPQELAAWRHAAGLDRPLATRYAAWLAAAITGDLGVSLRTGRPVTDEIAECLVPTLELNLAAFAFVAGAGLALGWSAARRAGGRFDRALGPWLLALYAVPTFWIALLLQELLAVHWRVLPLYGRALPGSASPGERFAHLLLPATCLAVHNLAFYARLARNTAVRGATSAHALAARSAGVPEGRVFLQHAIRPSLTPLAALVGLMLPAFAAGSVLVESVFAWPGLGSLFVSAVLGRDVPVVLGLTVIAALLTVLGSGVADALGAAADPRVRAHGSAV